MSDIFDPEGVGFDDYTAQLYGMVPDEYGHMGSVVPVTPTQIHELGIPLGSYMILKGRAHPTYDKAVAAEIARGHVVEKIGDRYFSVPVGR